MKAYEIFVTKVSYDLGLPMGDERIAIVTTEEKVANKIAAFREKHEGSGCWMDWDTEKVDGEYRIRFKVKEVEVE